MKVNNDDDIHEECVENEEEDELTARKGKWTTLRRPCPSRRRLVSLLHIAAVVIVMEEEAPVGLLPVRVWGAMRRARRPLLLDLVVSVLGVYCGGLLCFVLRIEHIWGRVV
ncbi:hypothetical protein Tsubulata_027567, partial [Turnera subulata]